MKRITIFVAAMFLVIGMVQAQNNNPQHGWHTYCGSDFSNAISQTTIATCYPQDMAIQYAGTAITKVGMFSDDIYNAVGGLYSCSIYLGGETPTEGIIVYTMTVDVPQGLGEWAEFDLSTPIWVTGDETIWIVWQTEQALTPYPMGVCSGSDPSGNGNWAWNGSEWEHLDYLTNGDWTVKTYFNWDGPQPQPQDVYVSGNHFTTGKVLKNNTLLYSITDSIDIQLKGIQVAEDGTVYGAGYAYNSSDVRGHVWMNDSCIFIADTNTYFDHIALNGNNWIVAGFNNVWQNGELLYSYSYGEDECHIQSLAVDTTTGDIYAGGPIFLAGEYLAYASVWKNDSLFWMEDTISSVQSICFDGENLYAAGFKIENDSLFYGVIWQNDSIIYQLENANFGHIAAFDGSLYWSGIFLTDTVVYIWQDGEVLYDLPELSGISNLVVNESGVYYTDAQTVYKDGEVLYQPEECIITDLVVKPTPPQPEYTIIVESNNPEWGSVSGGGTYPSDSTATLYAFPEIGCEFLYWNDSITDNPRTVVVTQDSTFVASFARRQFTIEVVSDHPEWGSVSGSGTYYYGDTIQISATPNLHYLFVGWTDGVTDNPRTVIVSENQTFTAHFEIAQYYITTIVIPENAGTVQGGGTYFYGDTISLVVIENTGYIFDQWEDGMIDNPRQIIVEDDATYIALFTAEQYEVTVDCDPIEGGTVTGAGFYDYGTTATLTATPNENYIFLCWSDGIVSNPRNVLVTHDIHLQAWFYLNEIPTFTVTVVANDPNLGTVNGSGTYPKGTIIEISATPFEDVAFVSWDDGNTDNPRRITVTENMSFKAIFKVVQETFNIIVTSNSPLLGSVYGGGTFAANTTITIGATPREGVYFTGWQDGNTNNPRNIIVTSDATYTAYFAIEPVQTYSITVQCDEEQGYIIGGGNYVAGSIATLAAIANDNYYFVKWDDGNTDNPRSITVDHDITLTAYFNSTGLDENDIKTVNLYPNPASDKIHVKGIDDDAEISIYNTFGVCVKKLTINGEEEISVNDLATGLYLVRINGSQTVKFVKR